MALKDVNWRKNREDVSVIERDIDRVQVSLKLAKASRGNNRLSFTIFIKKKSTKIFLWKNYQFTFLFYDMKNNKRNFKKGT